VPSLAGSAAGSVGDVDDGEGGEGDPVGVEGVVADEQPTVSAHAAAKAKGTFMTVSIPLAQFVVYRHDQNTIVSSFITNIGASSGSLEFADDHVVGVVLVRLRVEIGGSILDDTRTAASTFFFL